MNGIGASCASPQAVTVGTGAATVYTNGQVVNGTWSRASRTDPFTLTDAAGEPILLVAGRTWVEFPDA